MTIFPKLSLAVALGLGLLATAGPGAGFAGTGAHADDGFADRQAAVLLDLASRYDPDYTGYLTGHRRNFGVHSCYLLAAIEVHRRGLGGGVSLQEAMPRIEEMLDHARANLDTWDAMALNPGLRMGAHVFPYLYHQWYDELSLKAREDIEWLMIDSPWKDHVVYWLVNGSVWAGKLLVGERLGYDSELWQSAAGELEGIYERTFATGGIELNSPIYSSYHFGPLAFVADKLEHDEVRTKVRILLDYLLIVAGHQYIPGSDAGFVGVPRMRQREGVYAGSARLPQHYFLFFGQPAENFVSDFSAQTITAVADYRPPAIIGSLFREKPESGYEFWTYTDSPWWIDRMGASKTYTLIPDDNRRVSPWHTVVLPDGDGMLGVAYGHRGFTHHVSMGAWVRDGGGNFHGIYHLHPVVRGDTYNNGNGLVGFEPPDDDPDDWRDEGYDYERFLWGRTLLSLWDPTLDNKASNVVRTYQDTRARIPNLARFGGEIIQQAGWYVGRMGDTYMAYRPLGTILEAGPRAGGDWFYVRLDGRSGCIIEMATTDDFPSLQAYADSLAARHLSFDSSLNNFHIVFDAHDPETGELTRLRLNYDPEQRFIDGDAISMQDYDRGFMDSPWVDWDAANRTLVLHREGYNTVIYDANAAEIREQRPTNALLMMSEAEYANGAGAHVPVNRAYVEFLKEAGHGAAISTSFDTEGGPLTPEQIEQLNGYELVIFPRAGAPDANFGHASWNQVRTPIIVHSPSLINAGNWGWTDKTVTGGLSMEHLDVSHPAIDLGHPVFHNVEESDRTVRMFDEPVNVIRTPLTYVGDGVTAEFFGATTEATPYVWVACWNGRESHYSENAPGEVHGRRTLFLWPANPAEGHTAFTAAGRQLLLNAIDHTRRKSILMLVQQGHSQEGTVRAKSEWIQNQEPGYYRIDHSADLFPDVLDSATSLNPAQMALLHSYDLILMPRIGVGASADFASKDWNNVTTPILSMNPFTYRPAVWGWVDTDGSITSPRPQTMVVLEPESPFFDGIDTSGEEVLIYHDSSTITMTSTADSSLFTGALLGLTDHEDGGTNAGYPWLATWTGDEERFFHGGAERPAGPRTLLLGPNNNRVTDFTPAGQRLLMNAVALTLAAGVPAPPIPLRGYAAWLQQHFTSDERADDGISGPGADPAGDGVANAVNYILGLSPWTDARPSLPRARIEEMDINSEGERYLTLAVRRREPLYDATVHVDLSRDLRDWTEAAELVGQQTVEDGYLELLYRDPSPIDETSRGFLRMRIEWKNDG